MASKSEDPYSRVLGGTEESWCKAIGSGTGITILSLLFSTSDINTSDLQHIVNEIQAKHPRLRSKLAWVDGKPQFQVTQQPYTLVHTIDTQETSHILSTMQQNQNGKNDEQCHKNDEQKGEFPQDPSWYRLVEHELNINEWNSTDGTPLEAFYVRLYHLEEDGVSLVVLRVHTAICDKSSAATLLKHMLVLLYEKKHGSGSGSGGASLGLCYEEGRDSGSLALEDAIPREKTIKPFWSHGVDLLGYSLGSMRHANLPFEDLSFERESHIVRLQLSQEQTSKLQEDHSCGKRKCLWKRFPPGVGPKRGSVWKHRKLACQLKGSTMYGALTAAGLKSTAILKQIGDISESYCVVTLINCRSLVENNLSEHDVGFYCSAIMNTHNLNDSVEFWELAARCTNAVESAMKNRKHFADIGNINFLMCQAIQRPALTTSSSLRTSLLVVFDDLTIDEMGELQKAIGLKDYMGCSSIHGVGPSLAIFDTIKGGALDCTCVYPAPLHSRKQMQSLINSMKNILIAASGC